MSQNKEWGQKKSIQLSKFCLQFHVKSMHYPLCTVYSKFDRTRKENEKSDHDFCMSKVFSQGV